MVAASAPNRRIGTSTAYTPRTDDVAKRPINVIGLLQPSFYEDQ
jgi:hypothetical protein